jgi:hypothetical protein
MNLPLTMRAFELGNSFTTLGGRPFLSAISKSAEVTAFLSNIILPPFITIFYSTA